MDERLQFVARRLAGEPMSDLCREFGISRKTGYKIFDRYQQCGVQGLTDRSRRPYRYAHQLPFQVENYILNVKHEHSSWGARKIRERLLRRFSGIKIPAKSAALSLGNAPNQLWCTDYSTVFAGQAVGIKEVQDDIWLVSFMDYDLGYFDLDTRVLEPLDNPFGPRLSPM